LSNSSSTISSIGKCVCGRWCVGDSNRRKY